MCSVTKLTAVGLTCGLLALASLTACSTAVDCHMQRGAFTSDTEACLRFGVSTPNGPLAETEISRVTEVVGIRPSVLLSFHDFTAAPPLEELDAVAAAGAVPIVTWEPWVHRGGDDYDRGAFPAAAIAAGAYDDYLYRWADELGAHGLTVYLRFAHEPNGTWYPWSPAGGTSPETYVSAWRHVHDIFVSKGATNVKWLWAPNVPVAEEPRPITAWYPGPEYVDVVGIDGYNWGAGAVGHNWVSPSDLFDPSFEQLRALAPGLPLLVSEVGSGELGGSKAEWIEELVAYLDEEPGVVGFVWFDYDKETDWRLDSGEDTGAAMGRALREAGLS
ncbi:glycoside hydrolase family 26 protein [Rhodococcus qingshengii]|uniref:glycoside hydrolase family 26 protein n=1 Tax=Rhodococcus TaxID=1827 RepID=UPI001BAF98D9|nr:glycosyl hydrolase [Rhodococcus qingshengii]MBS3694114.1 endoglucanase [Rhodococcus qingshengii]